jgi:MOSC domain-containing protein YiiM
MEEQCPGLRAALQPDWRGGVSCTVLQGGTVTIGDAVTAELSGS